VRYEPHRSRSPTSDFRGDLSDDKLGSITWRTEKDNRYASREAVDLLNLEYGFMPHDSAARLRGGSEAGAKRWLKETVYARLPGGFRAFAYFSYRYVLRLGFLDGRAGTAFHFGVQHDCGDFCRSPESFRGTDRSGTAGADRDYSTGAAGCLRGFGARHQRAL